MLMQLSSFFFFNDTATTEIYTLSLHDALPILFMTFFAVRKPNPVARNKKGNSRTANQVFIVDLPVQGPIGIEEWCPQRDLKTLAPLLFKGLLRQPDLVLYKGQGQEQVSSLLPDEPVPILSEPQQLNHPSGTRSVRARAMPH